MPEATQATLRSLVTSQWAWPALALAITLAGLLELLRPGVVDPARVGLVVILLCAPVAVANRLPLVAACAEALVMVAGPGPKGFPETPLCPGGDRLRRRCDAGGGALVPPCCS